MKGMNNMQTFLAEKKIFLRSSRTYITLLIIAARQSGNYSSTFELPSESAEQGGRRGRCVGGRGGGGGTEEKCILGTGLTHCSSLNSCIAHLVSVASFCFLLTIFGLTFPFIILSLPSENGLDSLLCERQNPLAPSSMRLEPLVVST